MDKALKQYIKDLIPKNLPDWKECLQKGIEIGNNTPTGRSRFLEETKYNSYYEYKCENAKNGKITWQILMGLATLEEQLDGIKKIYDFSQRTGLEIDTVQCIPSQLICLPKEIRDQMAKPTSYVVNSVEEYAMHADVAPVQIIFEDQILSCPNSLETTLGALSVGSPRIGILSQFIWGYPGFDDDVKRFSDVVTSLGIVASKKDEYLCVDTYLDDGIPGYFMDCMSYVAYAMLDHYIVTTLCGARMSVSYGGLLSEGDTRVAVGMAVDKLLTTEDWHAVSYINGSTTMQWDHDINSNWGPTGQEMLLETLVEKKYKMCMAINPVSITEALRTPTVDELLDVFAVGVRTEEKADEWMPFMDFTYLEKIRDKMCEQAPIMFRNILDGLKEAGVDIENPIEMLCVLKKFNPMKFEMAFHPSVQDGGTFEAFYPTVIGRTTLASRDKILEDLMAKGYAGSLDGRKIIVGSADGHTYGLQLVEGVMKAMGADVVNGGVDLEPSDILDLADEEGTEDILVSAHVGQGLDYARQINKISKKRGKSYNVLMGGMLNGLLPGASEPVDVTAYICENGVYAENDLEKQIQQLIACAKN